MGKGIVKDLMILLEKNGANIQYGNEDITQLEHALQCASLAEQKNFSSKMITAALLHDIGHLLYEDKDPIHHGLDGKHEYLGANYLSSYFDNEIILPIRAHVDSKRYLSAVEKGYIDFLSEASKISLAAQGNPFTLDEAKVFIKKPFMKEAVELRRLDDKAKVLNKITPSLNYFKHYLEETHQSYLNN